MSSSNGSAGAGSRIVMTPVAFERSSPRRAEELRPADLLCTMAI